MSFARRATASLVAAVAVALSAGCSDAAPEPRAEPSPSGPSAVSRVRDAAATTEAAGSARYLLSTATRVGGQEVVLSGEGVYDWRAGKGRTTYEIPVGRVEQRRLGGDLFLVLPQQAGVFFRIPAAELASTALGGTVEPIAALHTLGAVTEAEQVEDGEDQVRGEPTTHFRGTYDVAQAVEATSGLRREALRSSLGAAAAVPQPTFDVHLDDQGRLRRLTQSVEVPSSPDTGELITVTTVLELYDFGLRVIVPGPPAPSIRDGAPLLAALEAALPSSRPPPVASGVPAPPAAPDPSGLPAPPAAPAPSGVPAPPAAPAPSGLPAPPAASPSPTG